MRISRLRRSHRRLTEALGRDVLAISAVTGEGLDKLLWEISRRLDERDRDEEREASRRARQRTRQVGEFAVRIRILANSARRILVAKRPTR